MGMDISRRQAVQGGAAVGAALALGGMIAGNAPVAARADEGETAAADVLVIGGGLGGVLAAFCAARDGAKVTLVEAGSELGGTMLMAMGGIMNNGLNSVEDIDTVAPSADRAMAENYVAKWPALAELLEGDEGLPNVTFNEDWGLYIVGSDYATRKEFFDFFASYLESHESQVVLDARAFELVVDDQGTVAGAKVERKVDGSVETLAARAVVLACGSYVNDPAMCQQYLGHYGDQMLPRATPYNRGDGHKMAAALGAEFTRGMGRYYGNVIPYPSIIPTDVEEYDAFDKDLAHTLLTAVGSAVSTGIVVNLEGVRFTDESSSHIMSGPCQMAIDLPKQTMGHGFLIIDSASSSYDSVLALAENGAVVVTADTLEELADSLASHGVRKDALLRTVEEYNTADPAEFAVRHSAREAGTAEPLVNGPFLAIQVGGGSSEFFGGVRIDNDGRVLGRGGIAIPHLYATACCAGGMMYDEYLGSLGFAATTGMTAGTTAAAELA